MKNKRIVFMGTATFSKEVLEKLIENKYNVVAVVTQPDRLVGRKKEIKMPEVKEVALLHNIPVLQPQRIRNEYQEIIDLQPDILLTAAYGQIIPEVVLQSASIAAINVHASLLPSYRGGAPVHYAIIDGLEQTGVTIMYMVKQMDAGNIISQRVEPILAEDTTGSLYDRLATVGANLLLDTLPSIIEGTNESIPQDESMITYSPIISRQQEKIEFNKSVKEVHNLVRGLNPWPVGYTTYQGKSVKLWGGTIGSHQNHDNEPGTIVSLTKESIGVMCSDGVYQITEFQVEGKRKMTVKDYMNGKCIFELDTKFE